MSSTAQLMKELITGFFGDVSTDRLLDLFADEFYAFGLAEERTIEGKSQVAAYLDNASYASYRSLRATISEVRELPADQAYLSFSLASNDITVKMHAIGTSQATPTGRALSLLAFSLVSPIQTSTMFKSLAAQKTERERRALLDEAIAGGMMGGYDEPGFPLYFINHRMLDYLGYPSEEAYRADTQGLTQNSIHPDDRAMVTRELDRQLAETGEYHIEYRMRTCSGSYLWFHGVGKRTTAPDGRPTITSVCVDISERKQIEEQLHDLVNRVPGGVCLYRWDGKKLDPIVISDAFSELQGTDSLKLMAETEGTDYSIVHPDDLPGLRAYMDRALKSPMVDGSWRYRIWNARRKQYIWIDAHASSYAQDDGSQLVYITYNDATAQLKLQQDLVDAQNAMSIAIEHGKMGLWTYDLDTRRLEQSFGETGIYDARRAAQDVPDSYVASGLIHPEDAEAYTACYRSILDGSPQARCTVRVRGKERDDYRWARIYLVRQQETQGCARRAIGFSIDVDEELSNARDLDLAQKQLKETQQATLLACSLAHLWTFVYDIDAGTAMPDATLQDEFGLPPVIEHFPEDLFTLGIVCKEDEAAYRDAFGRLAAGADTVEFDIRARLTDRLVHWLRYHGKVIDSGGHGRVAAISAQIIDEEKAVQARAELERDRLKAMGENLLLFFSADVIDGRMLECQAADGVVIDGIAGTSLVQFAKEGPCSFRYEADQRRYEELLDPKNLFEMYVRGEDSYAHECQIVSAEGRDLWARIALHLMSDPTSGHTTLFGYMYNIATEKLVEDLLVTLVGQRFENVGCLDPEDGQFIRLVLDPQTGQPCASVLDYQDTVDAVSAGIFDEEDRRAYCEHCTLENVADAARANDSFVYRVRENGGVRYKRCNALQIGSGKTCILTRSDVTSVVEVEEREKARLEEALVRAEKATQAKTEFLARMSHDIRTPLNAIIGLSALTIDDAENPQAVRDNMTKMRSSSDFLLGLVNDILDSARIEEGAVKLHPAPYQYREFLTNMRTMFKPQCDAKGITLTIETPRTNPVALVDKMRVNQIFFNILSNAVKYTEPGGRIDYTVNCAPIENGRMRAVCTITDTGIGMTEEYQKRLFTPFEQESTDITPNLQGTGLGLSIVKSLVDLMGGTVSIKSAKGKGTAVTVELAFPCIARDAQGSGVVGATDPVNSAGPAGAAGMADSGDECARDALDGATILLAEDHPLNAAIARKLLEKKGVAVQHASNGKQAVEMFSSSEPGEFDAILMDIRMPEMSGLDAARAIRGLGRPDARCVPIVALSANAYPEDVQKSLDAGMDAHLAKPIDPPALYRVLTEQLEACACE